MLDEKRVGTLPTLESLFVCAHSQRDAIDIANRFYRYENSTRLFIAHARSLCPASAGFSSP